MNLILSLSCSKDLNGVQMVDRLQGNMLEYEVLVLAPMNVIGFLYFKILADALVEGIDDAPEGPRAKGLHENNPFLLGV